MVTEMLLAAVANTTGATQNGLDIGDYTGIGALIATAITFYLTYRHGTQSEQTRIARETWEKISENNHKFNETLGKYKEINDIMKGGRIVPGLENLSDIKNELDRRCEILIDHINYYAFLKKHKQIKGKFTSYYTRRVVKVYEHIMKTYQEFFQTKSFPGDTTRLSILRDNYYREQEQLQKSFDKLTKSLKEEEEKQKSFDNFIKLLKKTLSRSKSG